jgi:hypothetical protein
MAQMVGTSGTASGANPTLSTQQRGRLRRLYGTMNRYRGAVLSIARPAILALVAVLLILVVLPAALGAEADSIR